MAQARSLATAQSGLFASSSYLSQVRRLRKLALEALRRFPVRAQSVHFIQHGENAVFRVAAVNGQYLLRIHRLDYHTKPAIEEELHWLQFLDRHTDIDVPVPVRAKNGELTVDVDVPEMGERRWVSLFQWVEGRFLEKSLRPELLHELGGLILSMQEASKKLRVVHRRYWTPEGLVGRDAKWGTVDAVPGIRSDSHRRLIEARRVNLRALRAKAKKHPDRFGLIHADLHFGNLLRNDRRWGMIDFDDSGWGFRVYDLSAPLMSMRWKVKSRASLKEFELNRAALIDGYAKRGSFDRDDEETLELLMTARHLIVIAWLHSRSDNPLLKKRVMPMVERVLRTLP